VVDRQVDSTENFEVLGVGRKALDLKKWVGHRPNGISTMPVGEMRVAGQRGLRAGVEPSEG
jgi:hypothetical protein